MYRQVPKRDDITGEVIGIADCIFRIADNSWIPFADDNTDYQEYLKWLALGNVPESAE